MSTLTKEEIINSLEPINHIHFHIDDLNEYAQKVLKSGKSLTHRNDTEELLSYVLYYDDGPDIFITMVWTNPQYQGKGLAKTLIERLINSSTKDIWLKVHQNNPAKCLYKKLRFIEEKEIEKDMNLSMRYSR